MAQPEDERFSGKANWPTLSKSALNPFEANRGFLAKISQARRRTLRCARQVPDRCQTGVSVFEGAFPLRYSRRKGNFASRGAPKLIESGIFNEVYGTVHPANCLALRGRYGSGG